MAHGYEQVSLDDSTDTISSTNPIINAAKQQHSIDTASYNNNTTQQQQQVQVGQSSANEAIGDFVHTFTSTLQRITGTQQSNNNTAINNNHHNSNSTDNMIDNISAQLNSAESQTVYNKLTQRDWKGTLRSPAVFLNPRNFNKPSTSTEATQRLEQNLGYYFTNYTIFIVLLTLFSVLSDPYIIILGVVLGLVWFYALKQQTIHIGSTELTGRNKVLALGTISGILIFIVAGGVIFSIIGTSSVLICLHAVFNNRGGASIDNDINNDLELSQV